MKTTWFALAVVALVLFSRNTPAQAVQPKHPEVEVMRGGTVEISLPIPEGNFPEGNFKQSAYSIIGEPRYGWLSNLPQQVVPSGHGPVRVTYTHGNDKNSVSDVLVYEVHSTPSNQPLDRGGKPLRRRGRVMIRILDAPSISGPALAPSNSKALIASATTKALITFGDISLGAEKEEFLRAYPRAKLVEEAKKSDEAVNTYSLLPPDCADATQAKFVFRDGKLAQIDLKFGEQSLNERGGECTYLQGLSRLFGNEGEAYQPDASGPNVKSARKWFSPTTGEAATLEAHSDGSARLSLYERDQ